mmetsp:Transcript_24561/g.67801  ORF Transcript_24561/g.67801 Transcript_24561/m.67801 type:complete len:101 (-) Transcript_24561:30-332(-)
MRFFVTVRLCWYWKADAVDGNGAAPATATAGDAEGRVAFRTTEVASWEARRVASNERVDISELLSLDRDTCSGCYGYPHLRWPITNDLFLKCSVSWCAFE